MSVNCFECIFCRRNGGKNPNIRQEACYCDCPDIHNKYDYPEYCRVSAWTMCGHWTRKETIMKKIIIGDHTYDIPDKVHILIEDLVKKNDRLRGKVRKAFMGEPVEEDSRSIYDLNEVARLRRMKGGLR